VGSKVGPLVRGMQVGGSFLVRDRRQGVTAALMSWGQKVVVGRQRELRNPRKGPGLGKADVLGFLVRNMGSTFSSPQRANPDLESKKARKTSGVKRAQDPT